MNVVIFYLFESFAQGYLDQSQGLNSDIRLVRYCNKNHQTRLAEMANRRTPTTKLTNVFETDLGGMCEVWFVRHGEQKHDFMTSTVAELLDAPLSPMGHKQAAAVGDRLASTRFDAVFASPLQRASDTAKAIHARQQSDCEFHYVDDIREGSIWAKLDPSRTVPEQVPREQLVRVLRNFSNTRSMDSYEFGEDAAEFRKRVITAVDDIIDRSQGRRVAVVCHALVIGVYLAHVLRTPFDGAFPLHHTSITCVRGTHDKSRRVALFVNDFSHTRSVQSSNKDNPFFRKAKM